MTILFVIVWLASIWGMSLFFLRGWSARRCRGDRSDQDTGRNRAQGFKVSFVTLFHVPKESMGEW